MSNVLKVMQQALEALQHHVEQTRPIQRTTDAIEALQKAVVEVEPISTEALAVGMLFCCGRDERRVLEIAALRNVVQVAMINGDEKVFNSWNHHFPDDQREVPKKRRESRGLHNMFSAMQNGELDLGDVAKAAKNLDAQLREDGASATLTDGSGNVLATFGRKAA